MINEAILGFFVDMTTYLVSTVMNIIGSPVSGTFNIPSPLFSLFDIATGAYFAIYPAVILWFVWRQVWGK